MFRNRPVSLALVGLFVWVTACTSYKQIEVAQVADYGKVRVTFADGERIVLREVEVAEDSIHYWRKAEPTSHYSDVWVSSPLDQVAVVEGRQGDTRKTAMLVVMSFVGGVALLAVICSSGDGCYGP